MKRLALLLALVAVPASVPVVAETRVDSPMQRFGRLQLDTMPLGQLVTILMRDIVRVPYVIQPDVIADKRPMSIDVRFDRSEMPLPVVRFLRGIGLDVSIVGGTVYVGRASRAGNNLAGISQQSESGGIGRATITDYVPPSGAASPYRPAPAVSAGPVVEDSAAVAAASAADRAVAVIRPAYRAAAELAEALETAFPDMRISARGENEPRDSAISGTSEPDRMVIAGDAKSIALAEVMVRALDRPRPQVKLNAVVFEVRRSEVKSSALQLLANVLGGRVQAGSGSLDATGDFIKIAVGGLSAVLSATRGDGRFEIVAEPSLVAASGSSAILKSGSQVPTVGSVTFSDDGRPIRSIEYRDSGISLTVRPRVRGGEIDLEVTQERSSFARTNTGVDETPTLNRSTSSSRFAIAPGETIAVAGLEERSEESSKSGFLGGLFATKSRQAGNSQLLVIVQADVATDTRSGETSFEVIEAPESDEKA